MANKRKVEVFSAGCPVCRDAVSMIKRLGCECCDITVLDMNEKTVADRAKELGVASLPAVAIDGKLADCCAGRAMDETALHRVGIGQPK